jgi:hypothetical protein
METALECCVFAEQCERKSRQVASAQNRAILLEAAASWRRLGDDLKAKEKFEAADSLHR